MTCPIRNCANEIRWHNTLCREHAKQIPHAMQYRIAQVTATLLRCKQPLKIKMWRNKYRAALTEAVQAVKSLEVA